jgi:glutamate N-acetyltransferase / amino-acid N-acetyltransferase
VLPKTRFATLSHGVRPVAHSVTAPQGFRGAGVAAGIKGSNRLDLGILASDYPCVSVALLTRNAASAPPVLLTRSACDCAQLRGVVVNSGNANAYGGPTGLRDAERMRLLASRAVGLPERQVAVCSTGVIGTALPMPRIERGIELAAAKIDPDGGDSFAAAIRTTDRSAKHGALRVATAEGDVRMGFAAKGAGMISPRLATMLCFVTCDAVLSASDWTSMVVDAVSRSFDRITVDGQESTNDSIIAFANGASGVRPVGTDLNALAVALRDALVSLAVAIVADGEGTTKVVRLSVAGARGAEEAEEVARAVGNSPLVKAAFYGEDPNWGRIVQSIGQTLARAGDSGPLLADIDYGSVKVLSAGSPVVLNEEAVRALHEVMAQHEIALGVDLRRGFGNATLFFSDLTHQYVTFNAEYTT